MLPFEIIIFNTKTYFFKIISYFAFVPSHNANYFKIWTQNYVCIFQPDVLLVTETISSDYIACS